MTDPRWSSLARRFDGLAPRVAAFLSLALLPLGLIAVYQTREFQRETETRAELSLLAITAQASAPVQQAIERALGTAETLGVLSDLLDDPATCSDTLRRFVGDRELYAFAGLIPTDGSVICSSTGAPFGVMDRVALEAMEADPRPRVRASSSGQVSGLDVLVVTVPLLRDREGPNAFSGHIGLSLPRASVAMATAGEVATRPQRLITFNADGSVLTSEGPGDDNVATEDLLPAGIDLAAQATEEAQVFEARDARGADHVYTVAPLVPGVAYAMGIWSPQQGARGIGLLGRVPLLFPFLMWVVSLIVAFWAIHRLVIQRVKDLGARMRRFGSDRSLIARPEPTDVAKELREIEVAFQQMAESILHDEARMEHAFRERGVLLLEVHHRVKNNLQLISSIISMQARRAPEPRTRAILRRLQDRVLTLATIYRSLYTSQDMGDVNAAEVLRAIVTQELRERDDTVIADLELEDLALDADKIVPLSFLTAEAVANAVANIGAADSQPRLAVVLTRDDAGSATIAISNTVPPIQEREAHEAGQGLGQHLIRAFSAQLGGPPVVTTENGTYRISVTFPVETIDATEAA